MPGFILGTVMLKLGFVDCDARRVRYLGYHGRQARPAAWSPDGRRLAFQLNESPYGSVRLLRIDKPKRSFTVIDEGNNFVTDVRWRGRELTYVVSWPNP